MEKDLDFLIDLQKRMNEQDCDCQASPYFWSVAENTVTWGINPNNSDEVAYYNDCESYHTVEECKEFFRNYWDEFDDEIDEIENFDDVEKFNDRHNMDGNLVYGRKEYNIISPQTGCFLTKQACKDHIAQNDYHYSEPHTYAMTAWRNPEFERVWNILKKMDWGKLKSLGEKENNGK